jgi:hypothetical protein
MLEIMNPHCQMSVVAMLISKMYIFPLEDGCTTETCSG